MWWYLDDLPRVKREREAIDALVDEGIGVENARWRPGAYGAIRVEVDLRVGEDVRSVAMTYPLLFPNAPPTVRPIGEITKWGGHQYLASGELCLQYRPDTWHPEYTGAHVLRSALELMAADVGVTHQSAWDLPSAHVETPSREIRGKWARLVLTTEAVRRLGQVEEPQAVHLRRTWLPGNFMMTLGTITEPDGSVWSDAGLPVDCLDYAVFKGMAVKVAADDPLLDVIPVLLKTDGNSQTLWNLFAPFYEDDGDDRCLLLVIDGAIRAFVIRSGGKRPYEAALVLPDPGVRLPPSHAALAHLKFAVLGCGSLGSKVATSLARSGGKKFILLDDDVFKLENLVRNDLDAIGLGAHKADALALRLKRVAAGVEVKVHNFMIGGQEPGTLSDSIARELAQADIIIDATGDHEAFNYAAGVAKINSKTMFWGRVFGGGYGGMIARSRPRLDPNPFDAREMIAQWCANPEFPDPPKAEKDYAAQTTKGVPMVADDADVSVIASHLARFIIDTATGADPSEFDCSAYMIGMRKEWIFKYPFDTWPINLGPEPTTAPAAANAQELAASMSILLEILKEPVADD
jgi:sulfur-carrier protein adenylyltransferase/sulfurtransferase